MKPGLNVGGYLAWLLLAWLLGLFLVAVPVPVLEKLLVSAALVLSVVASGMVQRAQRWFVLGTGLALHFAFAKYLDQPALPVLLLTAVLLVYFSTVFEKDLWKLAFINLGAIFIALALFEAYLAGWLPFGGPDLEQSFSVETEAGKVPGKGSVVDPELGYLNMPGAKITEGKTWKGEPVYRAVYATNQWGWRVTPNALPESAQPVLFMGCSFAFGQGVQDGETMAAAFERESGGAFRAYNFSAPGYGPHQVLRILERGIERQDLSGKKPAAAYYIAMSDHVARAAGTRFWDQNGPRYEFGNDGGIAYRGRLNDGVSGKARELLYKSEFVRRLALYHIAPSEEQERRYVAIVRQAAKIFRERYGAPFYVLYWENKNEPADSRRIAGLRAAGLDVITINQVFPDYGDKGSAKYLFTHDGHPLPEAQMQAGRFLAQYLGKRYE